MTFPAGPTGEYFEGKPLVPGDRGGLDAVFVVHREKRIITMDFGTVLTWLAMPPVAAIDFAAYVRQKIEDVFGHLPYDISTLPLKFKVNKEANIIETYFPVPMGTLAANPEVFLAWADRLDEAVKELVNETVKKLETAR